MPYLNPDIDIVTNETTLCWLRRDLRLEDNAALYHALKENGNVLPMFVFDTNILEELDDKRDGRVEFIHQSVSILKRKLEELGSTLLVLHGDPVNIFNKLNPLAVYANHDYEPYAIKRDQEVKNILGKKDIVLKTFKDHVIFEKEEILKTDGTPYTVFTPYSKRWKEKCNAFYLKKYPTEKHLKRFRKVSPLAFPTLEELGFQQTDYVFPDRIVKTSLIKNYAKLRNFPAAKGTSRLSVHLRFGTVSIRQLVQVAVKKSEVWLTELIWRDFYQMILWQFPKVVTHAFKPAYDRIEWRNNSVEFELWTKGETGYPLVDAGMRELNQTGFMHNRVRMVVASFLTKHLLIDWRWGEAYFAKKLLDFDLASNNGGWQWAAGSGCDAAPYFRVFNPQLQANKFDPKMEYIKRWVPEIDSANYHSPIVDHVLARERALKVYKASLS